MFSIRRMTHFLYAQQNVLHILMGNVANGRWLPVTGQV
jgi:hypothetical protein